MPGYKSEVSMTPSLDSVTSLKQLTELRKLIYSLDYRFITKDIKGYKQPDENRKDEAPPNGAAILVDFRAQHSDM